MCYLNNDRTLNDEKLRENLKHGIEMKTLNTPHALPFSRLETMLKLLKTKVWFAAFRAPIQKMDRRENQK